jgi:hypothetical protein
MLLKSRSYAKVTGALPRTSATKLVGMERGAIAVICEMDHGECNVSDFGELSLATKSHLRCRGGKMLL